MIRDRRKRRHLSLRHRTAGSTERPRLCVHRSNANISVQLIDDSTGRVLTGASSLSRELRQRKLKKIEMARAVGKLIAEK
ncbi:MAG: 50S ribosomal protein L18, partial [candidate division WOR-3 bacterium]